MFTVESCVLFVVLICFFFFKQKTAYEMRISDWSSDVCSSDLIDDPRLAQKVMIPTADNVRQCCSSFSGNYLDQRITGRDVDLPARCHAGIVADRVCTRCT